jgi:hypothetical protein
MSHGNSKAMKAGRTNSQTGAAGSTDRSMSKQTANQPKTAPKTQ